MRISLGGAQQSPPWMSALAVLSDERVAFSSAESIMDGIVGEGHVRLRIGGQCPHYDG